MSENDNFQPFRFRIRRDDVAYITVLAASESEAEDRVWAYIEDDYDVINDLSWNGDHDVRITRD